MPVELVALENLDPDEVQLAADEAVQALAEIAPELQADRGGVYDAVVWPHALLTAQRQQELDDQEAARSLADISSNPDMADPELVAALASNFGVERLDAVPAAGEVTIVRDNDATYVVPVGSVFRSGTLTFSTRQVFAARKDPAEVVTSTDRLITQIDTDRYAFTVTVVADAAGTSGMLRQGQLLDPDVKPVGFVSATAAADFRNGRNLEDNSTLVDSLEAGVARPSLANRPAMRSLLRHQDGLNDFVADSVVGAGDAEMRRDRHGIVPVGLGGRVDWYVRTDPIVTKTRLARTASLVEKTTTAAGVFGIWQFAITRDELPGFYDVTAVLPASGVLAGSLTITDDLRGFDLAGVDRPPDVEVILEAVYSPYQSAIIRFLDDQTTVDDVDLGATADYVADVRHLTRLADIQELVANTQVRFEGADVLVKAPVPVFVEVAMTLARRNTDAAFDQAAVKAAVVDVVNRTPFEGKLYASVVYDAVHNVIGETGRVQNLLIVGLLRRPDGTWRRLTGRDLIAVPDEPLNFVSYKTCQFFCDSASVAVEEVVSVPTPR